MPISPFDVKTDDKKSTEHEQQRALFMWANVVRLYGFEAANTEDVYEIKGFVKAHFDLLPPNPISAALQWLHSIPNGDQRGDGSKKGAAIAGGRLKAEGQKNGVSDICLPTKIAHWSGLYIELKRPGQIKNESPDQKAFGAYIQTQGFRYEVCDNWIDAATKIQQYLEYNIMDEYIGS